MLHVSKICLLRSNIYIILRIYMTSIEETASHLFEKKYKRTLKTYAIWAVAFNFLTLMVMLNSHMDTAFVGIVSFAPWLILFALYKRKEDEARAIFWQKFAEKRAWNYAAVGDITLEKAKMFLQGNDTNIIKNYITGKIENRPIRIFEYEIVIKYHEDPDSRYPYTVFAFRFNGHFPHIFLNYRDDNYNIHFSNKLPVPLEFEKDFHIFAPQKYEIEALAIFTPDLFHFILEENWSCDIELIDQELIIFRPGYIKNSAELEKEFGKALALVEKIAPSLDKARFEKIGDYAHTLS